MADIDLSAITAPISDDQPCGPDLDMEFDMDFMNFDAEIQGVLPDRYFSFDPADVKFAGYYERIAELLKRTHDFRLLVPLAKLRILQGDMDGYIEVIEAIHALLKERWAEVHPNAIDFLDLRIGQIATLDEMATSVLPFQHATLFRSRRAGAITFRKWQIATGELNPREGEESIDTGTIVGEIGEADPDEMAAIIEKMKRGSEALVGIRTVCTEEAGLDNTPGLEKLPAAFAGVIEMIERGTGGGAAADAGAGAEPGDGAAAAAGAYVQLPTGDVATRENAVEAMFQAEKYYALNEPSSPVVLLLREAQSAASKSFAELVSDLVPSSSGSAFFALGSEPWFEVSLSEVDSRNPAPDYEGDGAAGAEDSSLEDAGLDDGPGADNDEPANGGDDGETGDSASGGESPDDDSAGDAGNDQASEAVAENDEAGEEKASDDSAGPDEETADDAEPAEATGDDSGSGDGGEAEDGAGDAAPREAGPKFVANTRPEAVALIEKVLAYYRIAEPSSPVPLILERAIDLSSKSFIDLLKKVLPDGHLNVRE